MNIDEVLTRGVAEVLPTKDGLKKLMQEKKITLYQGFDPSMSSLHLGNLVGVMKLRQFQKLGHRVIFLIGDFTGMIGDPTDKMAVRKQLTLEEVTKNSEKWVSQIKNVLNFEGENKAEIMYNSQWLSKLSFIDVARLASFTTYAQVIERDMFQKRLKEGKDLYLSEFLYPLMQGYDSVAMNVDLEVGGSDQIFNMLMGRTLMKKMSGKEKFVLTTKLLVDKDGKKVGKTTGNALFLDSTPSDFYGGIMSFPDDVIHLGFELLTELELSGLEERIKSDPMGEKKNLAYEIVKLVWGESDADRAREHFEKTFQEKAPDFGVKIEKKGSFAETIAHLTSRQSTSEAKRLIKQGSVDVNNIKITDITHKIESGDKIKIGEKTFVQIN